MQTKPERAVSHPVFARYYGAMSVMAEKKGNAERRERMLRARPDASSSSGPATA